MLDELFVDLHVLSAATYRGTEIYFHTGIHGLVQRCQREIQRCVTNANTSRYKTSILYFYTQLGEGLIESDAQSHKQKAKI